MNNNRGGFVKHLLVISFLLLLFQSPLSRLSLPAFMTEFFGYYDELLAVAFFAYLVIFAASHGVSRQYLLDVLLYFVFLFIGLLGTVLNNLQPLSAVIEDIVACSKFIVVLYGSILLYKLKRLPGIIESLGTISRIVILLLFSLMVIDELLPGRLFAGSIDSLTGFHSVQLFFYHPAVLSQVAALLLAIVSADINRQNMGFKAMAIALLVSTLTSKALGFVCLYFFLCGYGRVKNIFGQLSIVVLAALCVLFVSAGSLSAYYGNAQSARFTLFSDSLELARENAPIGLGFGTFGSAAAASHYSPVYIQLGYLGHYGLGYINASFLTDTFWPVLFGQFGYLGTTFYTLVIFLIIKRCFNLLSANRMLGICALSIMGYLLICSAGATAFFNPISVDNALVLGFCLAHGFSSEFAKTKNSSLDSRQIYRSR